MIFAVINLHFAVIDLKFAVISLQFDVIILQFAVIDLQFSIVIDWQNVSLLWNNLQPSKNIWGDAVPSVWIAIICKWTSFLVLTSDLALSYLWNDAIELDKDSWWVQS